LSVSPGKTVRVEAIKYCSRILIKPQVSGFSHWLEEECLTATRRPQEALQIT